MFEIFKETVDNDRSIIMGHCKFRIGEEVFTINDN